MYIKGRQLQSFDGKAFTYNGFGQRISKGSTTFAYDTSGNLVSQSNGLEFIYNGNGVTGFVYNNDNYTYQKNAQGDIVKVLDKLGNIVVQYTYDAWGNYAVVQDTNGLAELNPFRYRSYYYDTETGLYYLKTRYYDPEVGRFITIDDYSYLDPENINGLNLYAYCGNNPVMYIDSTGTNWWSDLWGGITSTITSTVSWVNSNIIQPVGNFFTSTIPDFFVNTVHDGVLVPVGNAVANFFTNTIPNFFVNTVHNGILVPFGQSVANFFTKTIPDFFVNTVWKNWIVDKVWNSFIVGTIWNKGLVPAWNWVKNNWVAIADCFFAILAVAAAVVGIVACFVTPPLWVAIPAAIAGAGSAIWTVARLAGWVE